MADYPSLPLFTDAFIADTTHLSAAETGAYMMLLMCAWRRPNCDLPDDDKTLARWARCTPRNWARCKDVVMGFWQLNDGLWTQKKLSRVRKNVSRLSNVATQNANARWLKTKETENADASDPHMLPKPKPKPLEKEDTNVSSKKTKKGSRLKDFVKANGEMPEPPFEYLHAAHELGVDGGEQWPRFWDYWIAQPGQKGVKLDWLATWRNWCRRSTESNGGSRPAPQEPSEQESIENRRKILRMRVDVAMKGHTTQHELQPHEWQTAVNLGYVTMLEAKQRCPSLMRIRT